METLTSLKKLPFPWAKKIDPYSTDPEVRALRFCNTKLPEGTNCLCCGEDARECWKDEPFCFECLFSIIRKDIKKQREKISFLSRGKARILDFSKYGLAEKILNYFGHSLLDA